MTAIEKAGKNQKIFTILYINLIKNNINIK